MRKPLLFQTFSNAVGNFIDLPALLGRSVRSSELAQCGGEVLTIDLVHVPLAITKKEVARNELHHAMFLDYSLLANEYRIHDHLASLRVSVEEATTQNFEFTPWGDLLTSTTGKPVRRGFNDREQDRETGQMNHGVRQKEEDRFTSIAPSWERFPWQSPYVYANISPLRYADPKGLQANELSLGEQEFPISQIAPSILARHANAAVKVDIIRKSYVSQVASIAKEDGAARSAYIKAA